MRFNTRNVCAKNLFFDWATLTPILRELERIEKRGRMNIKIRSFVLLSVQLTTLSTRRYNRKKVNFVSRVIISYMEWNAFSLLTCNM